MDIIRDYLPPPFVWWIVGGLLAALVGIYLLRQARRGITALTRKAAAADTPGADLLTWTAASIATAVSAQGMWQFIERTIHIHWTLRGLGFAFIEVAVITSAVRARRNMRDNYSAGVDGIAVWALTGLSAVLSAMEAASIPEAIFRLAAPLVAAWLWERGMAIERRRATGRTRINWRITPERILVRVGLAEASDRTAGEVDAQRHINRVALAVMRARDLRELGASDRKQRKAREALRAALTKAVEHAALAADPARQRAMLDQIGALCSSEELLELRHVAPWKELDHPATTGEKRNSDALQLAESLDRWTATTLTQQDPEVSAAIKSMAAFILGRPVAEMDATASTEMTTTSPALDATTDRPSLISSIGRPSDVSTTALAGRDHTSGHDRMEVDATSDQASTTTPAVRPAFPALHLLPRPATTRRPVARPADDHAATGPTDRDQKAGATTTTTTRVGKDDVIKHVVETAKATGRIPSKLGLKDWSGWGGTSCLKFLSAGRDQLTAEGWTQDADGQWTRPGDQEETGRINGSTVVAS